MRAAKMLRQPGSSTTTKAAGSAKGAWNSEAPELRPEDCCVHLVQVRESPPGQPPPPEAFDVWILNRSLCRVCTAGATVSTAPDAVGCGSVARFRSDSEEIVERCTATLEEDCVATLRNHSKVSDCTVQSKTRSVRAESSLQSHARVPFQRRRPREWRKPPENAAELGRVASRLCIEVRLVRSLKALFDRFDASKRGVLDRCDFVQMIVDLTSESVEAIEFLVEDCWFPRKGREGDLEPIDFEGFLEWYQVHSFHEALALNPTQREIRKHAQTYGVDVFVAEDIYNLFHRFDEDGSGAIEYDEFQRLMASVLGARVEEIPTAMMTYFWRQCCPRGTESTSLEGLLQWYGTQFAGKKQDGLSLIEGFYRSQRPLAGSGALCASQPC